MIMIAMTEFLQAIGHLTFGEKLRKTKVKLGMAYDSFLYCSFWLSIYWLIWLVSFKYYESSRQMLRIERLTKKRLQFKQSSSQSGTSGGTSSHEVEVSNADPELS